MNDNILEKTKVAINIHERNEYFSLGKKRLNIAIVFSIVMAFSSFYLNWYASKLENNVYYFAATENGEFKVLARNRDALHDNNFILNWSNQATKDIFDFSFINYKFHLNKHSNVYFSTEGRKSLISALKRSETLSIVLEKRLIVSIKTKYKDIEILSQGRNKDTGVYEWKVSIPAYINYTETANLSYINEVDITLTVQRRSLLEDDTGLAISRILIAIVK